MRKNNITLRFIQEMVLDRLAIFRKREYAEFRIGKKLFIIRRVK